jgi:hypothetical protein
MTTEKQLTPLGEVLMFANVELYELFIKIIGMEELIKKHQKEINFLNWRLENAQFMGRNVKIRIEERLIVHTEILNDLKALANLNK